MTDDELIDLMARRCADPTARYDMAKRWPREMFPAASPELVTDAERRLGFPLHPLHRRVLLEIANGGFGPGYGLYGLQGGHADSEWGSMLEIRALMWTGDGASAMPPASLPLCHWGCGQWSWIDSATGDALTSTEAGVFVTGYRFGDWLAAWARGTNLYETTIMGRGDAHAPAGRRYRPPK